MSQIDALRDVLSEPNKDLKLNLSSLLRGDQLAENEAWGCALTSAYFIRNRDLVEAIIADSDGKLSTEEQEDAKAAAGIMGMNTIYYRSRHMIGNEFYEQQRASLRMNRMVKPASSREKFELYSMACAALAGCDVCLKSHEESLVKEGVSQEKIHEVLRVAAVVSGFVIALEADQ